MPNALRSTVLLATLLAAACAAPPVRSSFVDDGTTPDPYWTVGGGTEPTPLPPEPARLPEINRGRELLVSDRAVLTAARTESATATAPWSFRHVMETLAAKSGA